MVDLKKKRKKKEIRSIIGGLVNSFKSAFIGYPFSEVRFLVDN